MNAYVFSTTYRVYVAADNDSPLSTEYYTLLVQYLTLLLGFQTVYLYVYSILSHHVTLLQTIDLQTTN
jgi:hypothetical protein